MNTKKSRAQIIKEFLGLEELSPMEAGVIQGGLAKKKVGEESPLPDIDDIIVFD